jgi:phosphomannomutase
MNPKPFAGTSSLRANLAYEPQALQFGTSGRRGDVAHLTQLEIYITALAELEYLQSLSRADGGIVRGEEFFFACDLRPSSTRYVPEEKGRGEIAQTIVRAIRDAGMKPVNLGLIPTPALMCHAVARGKGSMMITGSHIPFERNGYKTNTARGELLKKDEAPINARVEQVRERLYQQPFAESLFNEQGLFKTGHEELPPEDATGRSGYIRRYIEFFAGRSLKGKRLLAYQHSAVGRDMLVEILRQLGAEVIPAGRSETFVPIDTENIDEEQLAKIQSLADAAAVKHGPFDAVVSTDGDSDRPLVLGVESGGARPPGARTSSARVKFFGGDLVGMIVAEFLGADAVVVPISCNDAIDRGPLKDVCEPKTRIGSPFVVAGMEKARVKGRKAVCGWEANGGFLTGSDIERGGKRLTALPTRDAMLPILGVLFSMVEKGVTMAALFERLPKRFSRAALLKKFPRPVSLRIVEGFSPADGKIKEVVFEKGGVTLLDEDRRKLPASEAVTRAMLGIGETLGKFFAPAAGFGGIARINYTDGVRIYFGNGDVTHVRPSGNADELRIYAVADTQARADAITKLGVAEPDGILRQLEKAATE